MVTHLDVIDANATLSSAEADQIRSWLALQKARVGLAYMTGRFDWVFAKPSKQLTEN